MKTRLKLKANRYGGDVSVLGQVKIGLCYETVVSVEISYHRDVLECKRIVMERLDKFVKSGFDKNGVIEL